MESIGKRVILLQCCNLPLFSAMVRIKMLIDAIYCSTLHMHCNGRVLILPAFLSPIVCHSFGPFGFVLNVYYTCVFDAIYHLNRLFLKFNLIPKEKNIYFI